MRSQAQQDLLSSHLLDRSFPDSVWIAANDLMSEGRWTWNLAEGETVGKGYGHDAAFSAWRPGEPNDSWSGGEDCAVMQVGSGIEFRCGKRNFLFHCLYEGNQIPVF